ncbi:MAG: hypothetical protein M5U26_22420 [Planctomycetota bacterium]|nr:hypothetical protein [Planctomycetota bacterium]
MKEEDDGRAVLIVLAAIGLPVLLRGCSRISELSPGHAVVILLLGAMVIWALSEMRPRK